ncbi:hypothetical protein BGZ74_006569, partial [Mortierella antarctica]
MMAPISRIPPFPPSVTLSTASSLSGAAGEHSAVQLSPPPGSQAQQSLTVPTASPNRPPFKEIAAGASCMSLFPANSNFEHLMAVVTAEGEGFIFDWVRNRHAARLGTATTQEEDSVIEKSKKHKGVSAATTAHVRNSPPNTEFSVPTVSTTGTSAKDK